MNSTDSPTLTEYGNRKGRPPGSRNKKRKRVRNRTPVLGIGAVELLTTPTTVKKPVEKPIVMKQSQAVAFPNNDICRIIESCSKAGVTELKYGDLEVKFQGYQGASSTAFYGLTGPTDHAGLQNSQDTSASPDSERPYKDPLLGMVDKELLDDMRRSQLMIDDPEAFEQEMINAHLREPSNERAQN